MAADLLALTPHGSDSDLVRVFLLEEAGASLRSRALALLFRRHDAGVRRVIQRAFRRSGLQPVDVEDVVQEAHARAAAGLRGLKTPGSFGPWLRRIARNEATSRIRSLLSRHYYESDGVDAEPRERILAALFGWPGGGEDSVIQRLDAARQIVQALATLPERARLALQLACLEGLSHDEIADRLGVPAGTIGSDLCRARQALLRQSRIPEAR